MPELSSRISSLKTSSTLAFNARAKELAAQGIDVIAMTAGEPDFQPPAHVMEAAHRGIELGLTKYTASEGSLELREAVVGKFKRENNLTYGTDQIVVGNGGKQLIYNALVAMLNPGDEVIIIAPYWVSYPPQIELCGGVPVIVSAPASNGFQPDPEEIEAAVTPRTKAIIINSPSNPTGAVYPFETVKAIADITEKHDLWLITDELYEHLVYEGEFTSAAQFYPERTVLIHGASKGYALTGWRIGFAAGPKGMIGAMNRFQGQTTSGANSLAQYATAAALNEVEKTAEFMNMTRQAYKERRDVLVKGLNDLGLFTPNPAGAFYVMMDSTKIAADENAAAIRILEEARVGTVPGTDFSAPNQIRFSYATSMENVQEAVKRIGAIV